MTTTNETTDRITSGEAAKILKISRPTLWRYTEPRGPIKCFRIGSTVRYDRAYIETLDLSEADTAKT